MVEEELMEYDFSFGVVDYLVNVSFTIVGAFIAIVAQERRERRRVQSLLKMIFEELNEFRERHYREVGGCWNEIEQGKKHFFNLRLKVSPDNLTTYRSNTSLIGQIENPPGLRHKIVRGYILLQNVIEAYEENNILLGEYEKAGAIGNFRAIEVFYDRLVQYLPELKREEDHLRESMKDLLRVLEKELAEPSNERFWER